MDIPGNGTQNNYKFLPTPLRKTVNNKRKLLNPEEILSFSPGKCILINPDYSSSSQDCRLNLKMTSAPRKCDRSEIKKLLAKLDSPSVVVRCCGIKRLPSANIPLILDGLRRAMSDRSPSVRKAAIDCLCKINTEESLTLIIETLNDKDSDIRLKCIQILCFSKNEKFISMEQEDPRCSEAHRWDGTQHGEETSPSVPHEWRPRTIKQFLISLEILC